MLHNVNSSQTHATCGSACRIQPFFICLQLYFLLSHVIISNNILQEFIVRTRKLFFRIGHNQKDHRVRRNVKKVVAKDEYPQRRGPQEHRCYRFEILLNILHLLHMAMGTFCLFILLMLSLEKKNEIHKASEFIHIYKTIALAI